MANTGDILLKYIKEYPNFESQSNNRLNELKRSFSNVKDDYNKKTTKLIEELHKNQDISYNHFSSLHRNYLEKINFIRMTYQNINNEFNEDVYRQLKVLDEKAENEHLIYEDILEQFEMRKHDAFEIYLKLTKENNDLIDKDMSVHADFIKKEQKKLNKFKENYDELNAKLNNKLMWTIEKSKNSINQLENDINQIDKNDLISLNKNIIKSLSEMRGTRNDINVMFKDTSSLLQDYKDEIYKIRKSKQRPYTDINQKLIQKLVRQIRIANDNKIKYQNIIKKDLQESKDKIYPLIIKAEKERNNDLIEKYILQTEALEKKADFLNTKIEKITNYNISTYQKRIKEIKVEAFTRNEEIKYTYSVPMKFIENSINIYSNYNFYFNQGFNDLDKLLTELISFSQKFNDIRDQELLSNKKEFSDYQNNLLAKITQVSEKLSDLLFNIDEVAFKITTLESNYRLKIAEIKKEMVNVDIKGDYLKFLESLNTDYEIANNQYKNRLKKINIHKLYKDKLLEIYKTSTDLNHELDLVDIHRNYNDKLIEIESESHREIYYNLSSQTDNFYNYQTTLSEIFMKIMKEKLTQSTKAVNYQLAKNYFLIKDNKTNSLKNEEFNLVSFIKKMQKFIKANHKNSKYIASLLSEKDQYFSLENYFKESEDKLLSQIQFVENKKTSSINREVKRSYLKQKQLIKSTEDHINSLKDHYKYLLNRLEFNNGIPVKRVLEKNKFIHTMHTFTIVYYELLNYLYQNSAHSKINQLNNYYDDFIIEFTENFTRIYDKIDHYKKQKKVNKALKEYLIYTIEKLEKAYLYMDKMVQSTFALTLNTLAKQLAIVQVNIRNHKTYINYEYKLLKNKSLRLKNKIKYQKRLINKYTTDMNDYFTSKVIKKNNQFLLKNKQYTKLFKYLEKEIIKMITYNDKKLPKLLKNIDHSIVDDYKLLLDDYKITKKIIQKQIDKINFDANVEIQYNNYMMDEHKTQLQQTRQQLLKQLDVLPAEKQTRLSSVEVDNQKAFNRHYDILVQKYAKIEKDKFIKTPILEKKIKIREEKISEDFNVLYNKHKKLEDEYLNQYIHFNKDFTDHHRAFRNNKIPSSLSFDLGLNQPLNDLLNTQSSMIDITKTIHKETSNKTQTKINELHEEKLSSEKKQSRIINS
ncbi:hypothetical protein KHQ88_03495 [Mycoplasmatota bacterium]|nr:hypothetical protein KHQ88_03495 [Mycoplasmatota bacterium]